MSIGHALERLRDRYTGQEDSQEGHFVQYLFTIRDIAATVSGSLLGPLMGISSMLWLVMRNEPAVDPRFAWMMFGAWFFFGLTYFVLQCRRVQHQRLYVFISVAFTCMCMLVIALLQRSSSQDGFVTVIPPCSSFAAYTIAYFFPAKDW